MKPEYLDKLETKETPATTEIESFVFSTIPYGFWRVVQYEKTINSYYWHRKIYPIDTAGLHRVEYLVSLDEVVTVSPTREFVGLGWQGYVIATKSDCFFYVSNDDLPRFLDTLNRYKRGIL